MSADFDAGMKTLEDFEGRFMRSIEMLMTDPASTAGEMLIATTCMQILHRVDEMTRMMRADFEDRRRRVDDGK